MHGVRLVARPAPNSAATAASGWCWSRSDRGDPWAGKASISSAQCNPWLDLSGSRSASPRWPSSSARASGSSPSSLPSLATTHVARRTALLAGATGLVGGHVLRLLLADESYQKITVLSRRGLPVTSPKLQQRLIDFDHLADLDVPRVDDVFCCLGTTIKKAGSQEAFRKVDFGYVEALARIAARAGAKQFLLVSAIGADAKSRVFYSRVKGETEAAGEARGV